MVPSIAIVLRLGLIRGHAAHDVVHFIGELTTLDGGHLSALADRTDRIKADELSSRTQPRPIGVERNIVVRT